MHSVKSFSEKEQNALLMVKCSYEAMFTLSPQAKNRKGVILNNHPFQPNETEASKGSFLPTSEKKGWESVKDQRLRFT